jgi:hypothetical protein
MTKDDFYNILLILPTGLLLPFAGIDDLLFHIGDLSLLSVTLPFFAKLTSGMSVN